MIQARLQFLTKNSAPGNFEISDELKSLVETVLTKVQIKGWLSDRMPRPRVKGSCKKFSKESFEVGFQFLKNKLKTHIRGVFGVGNNMVKTVWQNNNF